MLKEQPRNQEKDEKRICTCCGFPTEEKDIDFIGSMEGVNLRTLQLLRWNVVTICHACYMNMEEIDKGGENLALKKSGRLGGDHT